MARSSSRAVLVLWHWIPLFFVAVVLALAVYLAFGADRAVTQEAKAGDAGFMALAVLLAALGACATIEIVKRIAPIRGLFHRQSLRVWLGLAAEEELLQLLAAGQVRAGFAGRRRRSLADIDIPLEQLAARVSSLLSGVSVDPTSAPQLARHIVYSRPDLVDMVTKMQGAKERRDGALQALRDDELLADYDPRDLESYVGEARDELRWLDQNWRESVSDADQDVQNELDAFQLTTGRQWRRAVSTTAIAVSGAVGLVLAAAFESHVILVTTLLAAVVGGFLSWVLRDITAGLERWRQRP